MVLEIWEPYGSSRLKSRCQQIYVLSGGSREPCIFHHLGAAHIPWLLASSLRPVIPLSYLWLLSSSLLLNTLVITLYLSGYFRIIVNLITTLKSPFQPQLSITYYVICLAENITKILPYPQRSTKEHALFIEKKKGKMIDGLWHRKKGEV